MHETKHFFAHEYHSKESTEYEIEWKLDKSKYNSVEKKNVLWWKQITILLIVVGNVLLFQINTKVKS